MEDEDNPHRKMTPRASGGRSIGFSRGSMEAMNLASHHARLILGSFRADQANDPDVYITAIAHLLSKYPPDIGARLTDPKDGVAGKFKWLPTVSEVKDEAERLLKNERDQSYRAEQLRQQWELRDRVEAEDKAEPLEYRQKVAERILREIREAFKSGEHEPFNVFVPTFAPQYADMVRRGGRPGVSLEDKRRKGVWVRLSWLQGRSAEAKAQQEPTPAGVMAKFHITPEQWDAIPDLPPHPDDHWKQAGL